MPLTGHSYITGRKAQSGGARCERKWRLARPTDHHRRYWSNHSRTRRIAH